MLKKIKLKKMIVWNLFFLIMILLFIFGYTNRKEKYDFEYIASPEFVYYIENEAPPDEIKEIAISHSNALFSTYENQYKFYQFMLFCIVLNLILLVNENMNQRKKKNKVPESAEA